MATPMYTGRNLSNVLGKETQEIILTNRKLVNLLVDYDPQTIDEVEAAQKALIVYNQIQALLRVELPIELVDLIEKIPVGHGPHVNKPGRKTLLKQLKKQIQNLQKIDARNVEKAQTEYKKYLKMRNQVLTFMDENQVPKLEINPRHGDNEHERRGNRLRILTYLECNSCYVCGYPFQKMLDVHHKKPLYLGGTNAVDNYEGVCCNCHRTIHRAIADRGIKQEVKDYYSIDPDMLERLETLVKIGIGE